MRDRAWRRHQRQKHIKRVEGWMRDRGLWTGRQITKSEAMDQYRDWARRRHGAKAVCSGFCCGNPRRHFGEVSMAERRFADLADCQESDRDNQS